MDDCAKTNIIPVLVWTGDLEIQSEVFKIIRDEFEESIVVFSSSELPDKSDKQIEDYNFHVLKVFSDRVEIVFLDNSRVEIKRSEDLVVDIERACRKILHPKYY